MSLVLDLLLPQQCLHCQRWAREPRLGLCRRCRCEVRLDGPHCASCCGPRPHGSRRLDRCGACLEQPPALERLTAVWEFRPPLDHVVHAFKFGGHEFLGRELAERAHRVRGAPLRRADALVPIPLHWRRRLRRGFNQAEVLARALGRSTGTPVARALQRPRAARPQSTLQRAERMRAVRRAFRPRPRALRRIVEVAGKPRAHLRLFLVDDVTTTGATLEAAARALRSAGIRHVEAWVIARAPLGATGPAQGSVC